MKEKKLYFAPMEGVAGYIFRNIYIDFFDDADKFFSPLVVTRPSGIMKNKELRDILPENNEKLVLIPQILANNADGFINASEQMRELGYDEVNLNLGCPSGTVVSKKRGAGFLKYPDELDEFFDRIFSSCNVRISVKTRIGFENPEEIYTLMEIFNKYPIYELVIHPRTRMDMYKNRPNFEMFEYALNNSKNPVCYNGDIKTKSDFDLITGKFDKIESVMIGRGILSNPGLFGEIRKKKAVDKELFKKYHQAVFDKFCEVYEGDTYILFKLKELWNYFSVNFIDADKHIKKIRKARKLTEYVAAVEKIFNDCEFSIYNNKMHTLLSIM